MLRRFVACSFGFKNMEKKMDRRQLMHLMTGISLGSVLLPAIGYSQQTLSQPSMVHLPPGAGDTAKIGDMEITFKLSGKQTLGQMGAWETVLQPGELGAPPHYHAKTDEICRVLEGTVTIMTGNIVTQVQAGGWHLRPRNQVHTFWNSGNSVARTIDLCLPAGHADYMRALARLFEHGHRPTSADLKNLEKKYDIIYRFDLLETISQKYGVKL